MSFYDDASLVFLPSGEAGKDGKAYSMKPTNGDGDFTFSRGSNLTATRVDSNGLIEKGRENLFTYSNTFSNASWNKSETSVTSGQSGYDGSLDAWNLIPSTTNTNSHRMYKDYSSSGGVFAASIYAKANGYNFLKINNYSASVVFDISTGNPTSGTIVSESGSPIDSNIISVGNGWYRIDVTKNSPSGNLRTQFFVQIDVADSSFSGDGTSGVLIQDAQLEIGLVATEYIESGASTGKAGLLENEPRFDYSGGASCPSLLLEPSRTNLVKHSEYIDNSWVGYRAISTQNVIQSPSGTNDAALIYEDSDDNSHYFQTAVTTSSSTTYTQSAFVKKKDSGIYASLRTNGVGGNSYIIFDFDTATIVDEGSDIISSGVVDYSNGWYRIYMTYTLAPNGFIAGITNSTTNPIAVYLGTGKGYHLWGGQLEEGSYPTSYIPNHSGGSVTREADAAYKTGISSLIGQTEGTLFIDFLYESSTSGNRFSISDGTATNWIFIATPESGTSSRFYIRVNNSVIVDVGSSSYFVDGTRYKLALAYKSRDWAVYGNGTPLYSGTDNIPSFSSPMDTINFKSFNPSDAVTEKEKINQVLFFDTRISDNNLATLTS